MEGYLYVLKKDLHKKRRIKFE